MYNDDDNLIRVTTDIGTSIDMADILSYGTNGTGAGSFYTAPSYSFSSISSTYSPGMNVKGDASIDGSLKVNGIDIAAAIEKINKRLAILVPDPAKLEQFEALKKAYEHYKMLEDLCELPDNDD
jgi:hypothetical protein